MDRRPVGGARVDGETTDADALGRRRARMSGRAARVHLREREEGEREDPDEDGDWALRRLVHAS